MSSNPVTPRRTVVYVDGFNLYFGLVSQGWRKYLWLDLSVFARSIIRQDQLLVAVKYFTARVTAPPEKVSRQGSYLAAIRTLSNVSTIMGRYESSAVMCSDCGKQMSCPNCRKAWFDNNEKMTDVNIATHLIVDAYQNRYDDAILMSGDADQVPSVTRVRQLFSDKRVFVCFPPRRQSYALEHVATGRIDASEENYRKGQFSQVVDTANGRTVTRPARWMLK